MTMSKGLGAAVLVLVLVAGIWPRAALAQEAGAGCALQQQVLAWDRAAGLLLLVQHQDCTTRVAPLVFWALDTRAWELKGPFSHRRGSEPDLLRNRLAFAKGSFVSIKDLDAAGILIAHQDRALRKQGLLGSPFFPETAAFQPDGLPTDEAATAFCKERHPSPQASAVVEGGTLPDSDLVWCGLSAPEGRASAAYVFVHQQQPPRELSFRSALNKYHARVLRLEATLKEPQTAGFPEALAAVCKEADPALWDRGREAVEGLRDGTALRLVLLDPDLCPSLHRAVEAKKAVKPE